MVSIPADIKMQAIEMRIPLSRTLEEALIKKIGELERAKLARIPAPAHPEVYTTEAHSC